MSTAKLGPKKFAVKVDIYWVEMHAPCYLLCSETFDSDEKATAAGQNMLEQLQKPGFLESIDFSSNKATVNIKRTPLERQDNGIH